MQHSILQYRLFRVIWTGIITVITIALLLPSALLGQPTDTKNISRIFTLSIPSANGTEFSFDLLRKNKASVLIFLSESCPICRKYTLALRALHTQFSEKNIGFYGVFPSPFIVTDSVKSYVNVFKLGFPMLIDSNQAITRLVNARITPEVVVISSEGIVQYQGRIDNLFAAVGKQRAIATTHELSDVLTAISSDTAIPTFRNYEPVGCFIELIKQKK